MQADYAQAYRELYYTHWWWRSREDLIVEVLRDCGLSGRRSTILDVGCGDGLFFDRLSEFGVVEGVEPDVSLLHDKGPHRRDIYTVPFDNAFRPGHTYDVILMLDVLEHLRDPESALKHALTLLAPGGTFVATLPAFNALWTSHDVINQHVTRYDRATFRTLAAAAGLRIDTARYFFHWVAPVKLAAHVVEGVRPDKRVVPRLPRVPRPAINQLLYKFTRLEQRLLRRVSLPFGSSLLVVGGHLG